jgi:hypothetical protein
VRWMVNVLECADGDPGAEFWSVQVRPQRIAWASRRSPVFWSLRCRLVTFRISVLHHPVAETVDFHVHVQCGLPFHLFLVPEQINMEMNSISSSNPNNSHSKGSKYSALTPPLTIHFIALKTSYPDVQAVTFQAQFSGHSIIFIFTLYWFLSLSSDRAKMFAVVLLQPWKCVWGTSA